VLRIRIQAGKNGPRQKEEKVEKFHFKKLDVVWRLKASPFIFIYEIDPPATLVKSVPFVHKNRDI
jgi:hypothetical protein